MILIHISIENICKISPSKFSYKEKIVFIFRCFFPLLWGISRIFYQNSLFLVGQVQNLLESHMCPHCMNQPRNKLLPHNNTIFVMERGTKDSRDRGPRNTTTITATPARLPERKRKGFGPGRVCSEALWLTDICCFFFFSRGEQRKENV